MFHKRSSFYLIFILTLSIFTGMAFYLFSVRPELSVKIIIILVLLIFTSGIPVIRGYRNNRDKKAGIPIEDEMSRLLELHAAAYAFKGSFFLWIAISIFRNYFNDISDMLGFGILGSAALFGVIWLVLKKTGIPHAHQD